MGPLHVCASDPQRGSGLAYVFDPTGEGIQLDLQVGLPSDCKGQFREDFPSNSSRRLQGGKYNPACTTDASKCGGPAPAPTPPSPPPPPSPTPPPSPPSPTKCSACQEVVGNMCF